MDTISKICRLCLTNARRTYSINNTTLLTVWERLTNSKFDNIGGRPFVVCYICCAQLRRCHELEQRAVEAEMLFKKYVIDNHFDESKPLVSLIVSKADEIDYNYAIEHQYNYEVKDGGTNALEEVKEDNIYIKEEVKVELTDCSEESITAREPLYIEVKEHNISVKEEVKDELIEENITISEDLEVEESSIKEDLDSPDYNYAESNSDYVGTKKCLERDSKFQTMAPKRMFQREIQLVLPRIDEDDSMKDRKNVSLQNKALHSEVSEKGSSKHCLPECASALTNVSVDRNGEGNKSIRSIKRSGKKFSCDICHYECASKSRLNTHLRLHNAEKLYKCDLCDYRCLKKTKLNGHMQSKHINENKYSCQTCEKKFADNSTLKRHLKIHVLDKPYKCDLCDYKSSEKGNLEKHILCKHKKEKKYSCQICEKNFVDNSNLKRHLRIHIGDKPYECDLCDYRCSSNGNLKQHVKYSHTKEKKFSCHLCEMKFVTNAELKRHLRTHTGEKPYRCDLCDYRCSVNNTLRRHVQYKHMKERNYSCHICEKTFFDNDGLTKHIRVHTGEKPYKCDFCRYRCSHKSYLSIHVNYKHTNKKNISCHICKMKFVVKGDLNRHLKIHTVSEGLSQDLRGPGQAHLPDGAPC